MLRDGLGLVGHGPDEIAEGIAEEMATVLSMRTASHGVDSVTVGSEGIAIEGRRMRSHFALLFGDLRDESQHEGARQEQVRTAFNSPFWPFVLASATHHNLSS